MYSRTDCANRNPGKIACFCDRHAPISVLDHAVVLFVAALIFSARPAAIFFGIVSVVVFSIERHARRSHTHVIEKILKGFFPSIANSDSSPSIITKFRAVWVITTSNHRSPNSVFAAIFSTLRKPVFCGSRRGKLSIETTTTFGETSNQRASTHCCEIPANTNTAPIGIFASGIGSANYRKSTERFPNNIFVGFCHGF